MSFLGGLAGGAIGGAVVNLYLDDKQFKTGLVGAEAQTKGAATTMGNSWAKFGDIAKTALLGVGLAAVAGAAKVIMAASDQEEALNKVRVVFGENSQAVEDFASSAATNLGLSTTAALSAAGTFGNFFTAAGLASDAVAEMSTSVVTLSSDLASFNNIGTDVALEKLRAGLAGEAEPLRQLGVFLSEARVQQEAYTSGLAEAGAELTDAEKVQARYNLILQDTALAQGDFARTSDSLANQLRIVAAVAANAAATIGKVLLAGVQALIKLMPTLIAMVVAFGVAWVAVNFAQVATAISNITKLLATLIPTLLAANAATIALTAGLGLAAAALFYVASGTHLFTKEVDEMSKEVGVMAAAVEFAAKHNLDFATALEYVKKNTDALTYSYDKQGRKVENLAGMTNEAMKEFRESTKSAFSIAGESIFGFKAKFEGTVRSFLRGLDQMAQRAKSTLKDLREFNQIDLGAGVKKFLLEQGPEAIGAFVDANKKGRDQAVGHIQDILKAEQGMGREIDNATQKTVDLTGAMGRLGSKKATPTVYVNYQLAEGSLNPSQLPGMASGQG